MKKINNTLIGGQTNSYTNKYQQQNRTSLFASYKYSFNEDRLTGIASVRKEFVLNYKVPLTYSTGLNFKLLHCLYLQGNVNKVYRIPTLNDLYWSPGGNPNLKPEEGYSEDVGLNLNIAIKKIELKSNVNVFKKNIDNWIMWLPQSGGIWSPINIAKVVSTGLESNSSFTFYISKTKVMLGVNTTYVVSTNQKVLNENDESIGKQLMYVPMYNGSTNLTLTYKKFYFNYNQTYTGYRYTSSDNYEYLHPYTLGNIQSNYKFILKKYEATISVQVNNIWNTTYQVVRQQAMPLRNFQLAIYLKHHEENK